MDKNTPQSPIETLKTILTVGALFLLYGFYRMWIQGII